MSLVSVVQEWIQKEEFMLEDGCLGSSNDASKHSLELGGAKGIFAAETYVRCPFE